MVNEITLIGRLGRDPELKTTTTGKQVCTVTLATTEKRDGQDETTWHDIVAWGKTAEFMAQYARKGVLTYIKGTLKKRTWEDKNGQKRVSVEVMADRFRVLERSENRQPSQQSTQNPPINEEEIPF